MKLLSANAAEYGSTHNPQGPVLHLVGRVTDAVFSFLGPVTSTLAEQGVAQTVVLTDDPLYRHILPKFHESVRLVLIGANGVPGDQFKELLNAYCDAAQARQPSVVHLHGVMCSLLGLYASRFCGVSVPTYFSPHGSKTLGPLRVLGAALLWLVRPWAGRSRQRAIASSGADARSLGAITRQSVDLVESRVGEEFFTASVPQSTAPHIITGSRTPNPLGAALFAQCAVLLTDQVPGLQFSWIGTADVEAAAQLKAAHIDVLEVNDDAARAQRMAASWVYVAPDGALGFPIFLAEAMALGLPCVAWDTPYHRDVIRHGETGFLCSDANELLDRVAELMESAELRKRMGSAARNEALARFDGGKFRDTLLSIYRVPSRG